MFFVLKAQLLMTTIIIILSINRKILHVEKGNSKKKKSVGYRIFSLTFFPQIKLMQEQRRQCNSKSRNNGNFFVITRILFFIFIIIYYHFKIQLLEKH